MAEWRERHAELEILVIRGNHDLHAGDPDGAIRATTVDEPWPDSPFELHHHPEPSDRGYVLAGHVHPAIRSSIQIAFTRRVETNPDHGIILTDNYNPVEFYDAANREEIRRHLASSAQAF